ncbi:hypothetical protein [Mesorhizobium sp.]|uniref:hypothetical protein n=1 Tax=Mesorhizobium sp. TaxID=1871066 RepID=UPI0025B84C2B|nr:hypothetical protein [Mesorhizobium sp.]
MALLRAKLDGGKQEEPAGRGHGVPQASLPPSGENLQVSDALRRGLEKPKW